MFNLLFSFSNQTDGTDGADGQHLAGTFAEDCIHGGAEGGNESIGNKVLGGSAEAASVNAPRALVL